MNEIFELQYALDTFYFLMCGALVMWMAAGFAMLEAGLVRSKNTTEILTKNISLFAVACTMYMVCGYHIMYADLGDLLLRGITGDGATGVEEPATYAPSADFYFQVVFVATAMSIVSGAVAERMKLWAFLAFAVVMTGFIYPMEGSWTWGGQSVFGLYTLGDLGFSDFAGSGIVHMAGASAALAGVLLLGARKGKYGADGSVNAIPGANLPMATLGTFILWLGWFGFNGGSVLATASVESANAVAVVFLNTNAAASGGLIAALIVARFMFGKADLSMSVNGALAGLVAITAPCANVTPMGAVIIGAIAGVIVCIAVPFFDKIKIDDPVGAVSVHLVCGIFGTLALGLFAAPSIDSGVVGLFYGGGTSLLFKQFIGIVAVGLFTFILSLVLWNIVKAMLGVRVSEEDEVAGIDISEHGMTAYTD